MRIWSLHPTLLDRQALVACWRETLLAQAVIGGKTKGYTNHPQLVRFRHSPNPAQSITDYLHLLADEADHRGYRFDRSRITAQRSAHPTQLTVTDGQLRYEKNHLINKLTQRSPHTLEHLTTMYPTFEAEQFTPPAHRLFTVVEGPIEEWEKV